MGKWRYKYLERRKAETAAQTTGQITVDLPEKGYLADLKLTFSHLANAYTSELLTIEHAIKSIQVLIDGGTVIKNYNMRECQALQAYWGDTWKNLHVDIWESAANEASCFVQFGRDCNDTEHMLNCSAVTNPQLKIEYDFTNATHDGLTYTVPTTPTMLTTVVSKIYDGTPAKPVQGFFRSGVIDEYNPPATGVHTTEVPRGEELLGLLLHSGYTAKTFDAGYNEVKLDFDNGAWVPIDLRSYEMEEMQDQWFNADWSQTGRRQINEDTMFDSRLGQIEAFNPVDRSADWYIYTLGNIAGGFVDLNGMDEAGVALATDVPIHFNADGHFPHHTMYLPMFAFFDGGKIAEDTNQYGRIELEHTTNTYTASAICRTIAEYLVRQ